MRKKRTKKSNSIKLLVSALLLTGACSASFYALSTNVLAMELAASEAVPTIYTLSEQADQSQPKAASKKTAKEADYHVLDDSLYDNSLLSSNELTRDEAARICAEKIEDLFDIKLDNTYLYMGYSPSVSHFPRATWSCDVRLTSAERKPEDTGYFISIDALTGEFFTASFSRNIDENVDLGLDSSLAGDNNIYSALAKDITVRKKLLSTSVSQVKYNCQGYAGNDPDITFDVYGENGERVTLTFSRYDKQFKGLIFDGNHKISDKYGDRVDPSFTETETEDAQPLDTLIAQ